MSTLDIVDASAVDVTAATTGVWRELMAFAEDTPCALCNEFVDSVADIVSTGACREACSKCFVNIARRDL